MASDEGQWVVAPNEARVNVKIGTEAKLAPEVREALDRLARVLEDEADVQGYMTTICTKVTVSACAVDFQCGAVVGPG